ncbi:MAG: methyltransferase domain-containing protein [Zetaproteobacteria bacterium]|nr:MAG: methyltransferase domain-containing protein [Zetaproteobacteria bacterium]
MTDRAFWEAKYRAGEDGWDRGGVNPAFEPLVSAAGLSPGARVLVPGCGRGYEVVELARRGFEVVAIDLARPAVDALQTRLRELGLDAKVVCGDLFAFDARGFDAVYEQTCLCALPPERWPAYAAWLRERLAPGGKLVALFMQTGEEGGPPFHCDLMAMRKLFAPPEWRWPAAPPVLSPHRHGRFELGYVLERAA